MRVHILIIIFIVDLLANVCHAQTTASCTFSTFKPPSGYAAAGVNGINDSGTIVGSVTYQPAPYSMYSYGLIQYANGSMTVYKYPTSVQTWLTRRSNSNVTVGYFTDNTGQIHGLVKYSSSTATVNYPANGKPYTFLNGINTAGTIVGRYLTYVNQKPQFSGFKWQNGHFTKIWYPNSTDTQPQGINDNGAIVGWYTTSPRNSGYTFLRGFILQNGTYKAINDPQGSKALGTMLNDINKNGEIAGNYMTYDSNGENQFNGFIYTNGTFKNVLYPGAMSTAVYGINDYGMVVGMARVPPTNSYTFIPFKANCK